MREGWGTSWLRFGEKGPQFLIESIGAVSSLLRSPLEVSGQKGTAGAAAAPGRCLSSGDSQQSCEELGIELSLTDRIQQHHHREQCNPGKPHIVTSLQIKSEHSNKILPAVCWKKSVLRSVWYEFVHRQGKFTAACAFSEAGSKLLSPQSSWYSAGAGRGLSWMCLYSAVTVTVQIMLLWL